MKYHSLYLQTLHHYNLQLTNMCFKVMPLRRKKKGNFWFMKLHLFLILSFIQGGLICAGSSSSFFTSISTALDMDGSSLRTSCVHKTLTCTARRTSIFYIAWVIVENVAMLVSSTAIVKLVKQKLLGQVIYTLWRKKIQNEN